MLAPHNLVKVLLYRNANQGEAMHCINQMVTLTMGGDHPEVQLSPEQREQLQRITSALDRERIRREVTEKLNNECAKTLR